MKYLIIIWESGIQLFSNWAKINILFSDYNYNLGRYILRRILQVRNAVNPLYASSGRKVGYDWRKDSRRL